MDRLAKIRILREFSSLAIGFSIRLISTTSVALIVGDGMSPLDNQLSQSRDPAHSILLEALLNLSSSSRNDSGGRTRFPCSMYPLS